MWALPSRTNRTSHHYTVDITTEPTTGSLTTTRDTSITEINTLLSVAIQIKEKKKKQKKKKPTGKDNRIRSNPPFPTVWSIYLTQTHARAHDVPKIYLSSSTSRGENKVVRCARMDIVLAILIVDISRRSSTVTSDDESEAAAASFFRRRFSDVFPNSTTFDTACLLLLVPPH